MVLYEKLEAVTSKFSNLWMKNTTLSKEFETSSKAHVETKAELAMDLEATRDDLKKKTR